MQSGLIGFVSSQFGGIQELREKTINSSKEKA
jgi:hypothetical protein